MTEKQAIDQLHIIRKLVADCDRLGIYPPKGIVSICAESAYALTRTGTQEYLEAISALEYYCRKCESEGYTPINMDCVRVRIYRLCRFL